MPRFSARAPSPHEIVGHLQRYPCNTVADCDHHLVILRARLPLLDSPELLRRHREDMDLLLDARTRLTTSPR